VCVIVLLFCSPLPSSVWEVCTSSLVCVLSGDSILFPPGGWRDLDILASVEGWAVNPNQKTSKVRDDKLGGSDHFSAAEKYKDRIVDIIGLEEREHCALVRVLGSA
jgi:hypothetical protein